MFQFAPPATPATFEQVVARFRDEVERLFKVGLLSAKSRAKTIRKAVPAAATTKKKPTKKVDPFPAKWSDFKDELSRAQYRKCAFCEGYAIGQSFGDVEHFSPKSEVQTLRDDETTWGEELPFLANVKGRLTDTVSATGYWWRAYEWDNYILACQICNQQWKRAIFPIKETRNGAPTRTDVETHYLLHPFQGESPLEHLAFGRLGEVTPKQMPDGTVSVYGRETIRTLGLDRPSLREQRRPMADKIHRKIDALVDATLDRRLELLDDIYLEGGVEQPHCGMVRSILEQRAQMSWAQLEAAFNQRKG